MKLLFRSFLLLCFLAFSGCSYLHTQTNRDNAALTFKSADSGTKKESHKIKAAEIEEGTELISFKKCIDISNYFTTFFYAQTSGYFNDYLNNGLSFEDLLYSSSYKYIMYRVIRR